MTFRQQFITFDAVRFCKSAGIIPFTFYNGHLYFLFQQMDNPINNKQFGLNDFGGKQNYDSETTFEIASREFSEETSCLFYLKETKNDAYNILKHNDKLEYDENAIQLLNKYIQESNTWNLNKLKSTDKLMYVSSKETYISYFLYVPYVPAHDIPKAEDIHIPYNPRFIRTCKWFSYDEIMGMSEIFFHKRLQITKIQTRIYDYYHAGLFNSFIII